MIWRNFWNPNKAERYLAVMRIAGVVSDARPHGSCGHRVNLMPAAVSKFILRAVGRPILSRHRGASIGTILEAEQHGEIISLYCQAQAGLHGRRISYELYDVKVDDLDSPIWDVTDFEEVKGIAVLDPREVPAYSNCVLLHRP